MKLSIVATLYRSAAYIEEFCRRAHAAAEALVGDDHEIVLVNDGSPDNSLDVAVTLARHDPRLTVVDLSRNFGHHKAMMTGLSQARGELVYLLDVDLEEEPEWLAPFAERMHSEGCDVVYGVQQQRKGSFYERWSGALFYTVFRTLSGLDFPRNITTARLMTRRYVDALLGHKEREIMIAGLWLITGFAQCPHVVNKWSTSETTYTLRRKVAAMVNGITSFSDVPLKGIFYIGLVMSALSALYVGYLVLHRFVFSMPVSGWTSVMASIWLLGGLIIFCIGIVGIYLSKVFMETKQRPYTIIRQIYGRDDNS